MPQELNPEDEPAVPGHVASTDRLGLAPERTYTRTQLLAAIEAERHACSMRCASGHSTLQQRAVLLRPSA